MTAMALQCGAALGANAIASAAALVLRRAGAELEPVWSESQRQKTGRYALNRLKELNIK